MKIRRILALALAAVMTVWACQEENPEQQGNNNNPGTEQGGNGNGNGNGNGTGTGDNGNGNGGSSENTLPGVDTSGQDLIFTEIDPTVYKYPQAGDTMNPNLIVPDYGKMTLEAIDTAAHTATLKFAGEVPTFYKGCIIVPVKDDNAYPMFVLSAQTSGNTVQLEWRAAAIGEIMFNTSVGTGSPETKGENGKKPLDIVSAILDHVDHGFFFNFKGITLKLEAEVVVVVGSPIAPDGMSINSPVKLMKVVLTGTAKTGAEWGLEPSAGKSINYKKVLKQGVVSKTVIFWVYGVPIPVDFDVDLVAQVDFLLKVGAIKYSQEVTYTAQIKMGGTMNFETGVYTPENSFTSTLSKGKPQVEWSTEVQATLEASIYPSLRTYVCKFEYAGLQIDFKPLVGKVDFKGQYKDGHFFHSFDTQIRTDLTFNAYFKNPKTKKITYLLEDRPDFSKVWMSWTHPKKLTNADEGKKINGSFNRGGKIQTQVRDLDWDGQLVAPVSSQQTCVEVEPFGSLPDPQSNPDYYKNWNVEPPSDGTSNAPYVKVVRPRTETGWYSYGKSYQELDEEGNVELDLKSQVPAGQGFKYVVRLLDGDLNVIEEFTQEIELAVKDYSITQKLTAPDGSIEPRCVVTDYGLNLVEDTDMPEGAHGHVEFHGSDISGYLTIPGFGNMPVEAFFGSGVWLIRNHPVGPDGGLFTTAEGNDFVWWAHEKGLAVSTYGSHYSLLDYHGLPCTKMVGTDITLIYFQNILLYLHSDEGVTVNTLKLEGVDGWYYQ